MHREIWGLILLFRWLVGSALAFICLPQAVFAQLLNPFPFQFSLYTTQHGLSHNYTYRCQQDGFGFLWIATQHGLNRFDGYRFEHFYHHAGDTLSLPQNDIPALAIDKQNRIWTGGAEGIGLLNQATGKTKQLKGTAWPRQVWAMVYDSIHNCVWVAHRKGIMGIKAGKEPEVWKQMALPLEQPPTSIAVLPNGTVLMHVTRRSSWWYHPHTGDTARLAQFRWFTNTHSTSKGEVWLCGWGSGIHQLDVPTLQPVKSLFPEIGNYGIVVSDLVEAPALTGDSLLWVIGTNTGKMLYHKQKNTIIHRFAYEPQLKSGTATELHNAAYYAPNGTLWVCSWMGLEKINNYTHRFQQGELPALHTIEYNMLSGIQRHHSRPQMLWVAIHGSGIALMNGTTGAIEKSWYRTLPHPGDDIFYGKRWVQSLHRDRNGTIWGGSYEGFVRIEKDKVSFVETLHPDGSSLHGEHSLMDGSGWLWMTCWRGLVGYHTLTGQKRIYPVSPLPSHSAEYPVLEGLAADTAGYKYLGGQFGLLRFREGMQDTQRLAYRKDPAIERIIGLAVSGSTLLVGAYSGLYAYDLLQQQGRLIHPSILPVHAHGMKTDSHGNIWIYTKSALVKYETGSGEFDFFNTVDGLYAVHQDWATLFEFEGKMHLGHRMAYTRWDPEQAGRNTNVPVAWVSGIYINGRRLPLQPLQDTMLAPLGAGFRNLQFSYTAIEYQHAEQLAFKWRLLGYDTAWQRGGNGRQALFTTLPAGKYTFQLMAINSSGLPGSSMVSIRFQVEQHWWLSLWFWLPATVLLTLLLGYLVRYREKKIVAKANAEKAVQKQIAGLQMATLRSQMNPHFIFNSLNSIQKFIWENKKDDASEFLSKFARLIRSILHLSHRDIISLREELDLLKLYLDLEHRRCNGRFEYAVVVGESIDVDAIKMPPLLLQPFVENAIWHGLSALTNPNGYLEVNVAEDTGRVSITITDNGIGRQASARLKAGTTRAAHTSMGIALTRQRMELLGYQLDRPVHFHIADLDASLPDTGTVVTIFL